ncbi:MAG: hypothetical protein ABIW30_04515 [Arenimonas sp.]
MSLIAELRRRKVFKVGAAYLVVGWLLIQIAATVAPQLNLPEWSPRLITLVILLGFPVAILLAWAVDLSADGVRIESAPLGNKRIIIAAAVLAALAVGWYFHGQPPIRKADVIDRSIAVLPFVNMSGDPAQEFFSDGIAEELLNRLAQFPDLKVAARTSAFQFKGQNLDIGEIGRRLKVAHVLEGSVRKGGTTLRITAQLIDSGSGYHLWSETYDRDASDVLKVQDEIASAIANALETKLSGRALVSSPAQTTDPAAYDDYLQGRAFIAKRWLENLDKAILAFDRAIAKDPNYSAAHSGRAFAFLLRPMWDSPDTATALAGARASSDKALQLDPNNAEAYMVRGMAASFSRDAKSASTDLDHALALAPGSVDVLNFDGDLRTTFGDLGRAEREKRQAMALDPLAFVHPMNLSDVLVGQGRYEEATVAAQQAVALGASGLGYDRLLFVSVRAGHFQQAKEALEKGCAIDGPTGRSCEGNRAMLLAATGHRRQADALLDELAGDIKSGKRPSGIYVPATMASLYLEAADIAKATAWQRAALDADNWFLNSVLVAAPGGAKLPEEISTDPKWLAVWADPRMKDVMAVYRRNLLAWRSGRR